MKRVKIRTREALYERAKEILSHGMCDCDEQRMQLLWATHDQLMASLCARVLSGKKDPVEVVKDEDGKWQKIHLMGPFELCTILERITHVICQHESRGRTVDRDIRVTLFTEDLPKWTEESRPDANIRA